MPRHEQRPQRRPPRVAGQRRPTGPPPEAPVEFPADIQVDGAAGSARTSTIPRSAPTLPETAPAARRWRGLAVRLPALRWDRLRRPALRRLDLLGTGLIAAVVVLATVTALLLQGWLHARAVASARGPALRAASAGTILVLSYDYRHFDADVAKAESHLTKAFKQQYHDAQVQTVRTPALKYHATVKADVVAAGIIDVKSPSHVRVLVFVDQTSSNTRLAAPRIDRNRVEVDMRKVNGHWLIGQLTPI